MLGVVVVRKLLLQKHLNLESQLVLFPPEKSFREELQQK